MGLLDFFRRRRVLIQDAAGLAEFIDRHAAFVAQKGIYEYSRARAGHYAKVLFNEQTFLDAIDHSRWRAYPLGARSGRPRWRKGVLQALCDRSAQAT